MTGAGKRAACLLPSASETLAFIGGESCIVGRSHECDFPAGIKHAPVLTGAINRFDSSRQMHEAVVSSMDAGIGLYTVDAELLKELSPDIILTQSLCSVCSIDSNVVIKIAAKMHPRPVVVSLNPFCVEDVIQDCVAIGDAVGLPEEGRAAAAKLQSRLDAALQLVQELGPAKLGKVAFLEWTDPLFPGGHWTPQLIHMAGGSHPINLPTLPGGGAAPSAEMAVEAVVQADPDWIILCPCGLDIDTAVRESQGIAQAAWWQGLRAVREERVVVVDGNHMFNRPGPRLLDALEWLVGLLHQRPDLMPPDFPWQRWDQAAAAAAAAAAGKEAAASGVPTNSASAAAAGAAANGLDGSSGSCLEAAKRVWCAPGLPADIEEAHATACSSGKGHYMDPHTGYLVFSEEGLLNRGSCCGNRCRHCPYGHLRVTKAARLNLPSRPLLLDPKMLQQRLAAGPAGGKQQQQRGGMGQEDGKRGVVLVPWAGGALPVELIEDIEASGEVAVLLVAFNRDASEHDGSTGALPHGNTSSCQAPGGTAPIASGCNGNNGTACREPTPSTCKVWGHSSSASSTAVGATAGTTARVPPASLSSVLDTCLKLGMPLVCVPLLGGEVCHSHRCCIGCAAGGAAGAAAAPAATAAPPSVQLPVPAASAVPCAAAAAELPAAGAAAPGTGTDGGVQAGSSARRLLAAVLLAAVQVLEAQHGVVVRGLACTGAAAPCVSRGMDSELWVDVACAAGVSICHSGHAITP